MIYTSIANTFLILVTPLTSLKRMLATTRTSQTTTLRILIKKKAYFGIPVGIRDTLTSLIRRTSTAPAEIWTNKLHLNAITSSTAKFPTTSKRNATAAAAQTSTKKIYFISPTSPSTVITAARKRTPTTKFSTNNNARKDLRNSDSNENSAIHFYMSIAIPVLAILAVLAVVAAIFYWQRCVNFYSYDLRNVNI